jgi:hypothetical protein
VVWLSGGRRGDHRWRERDLLQGSVAQSATGEVGIVPVDKAMAVEAQNSSSPEPIVRFTVDISESMHRELSIAVAKRGQKKVVLVRLAIAQLLKDLEDDA